MELAELAHAIRESHFALHLPDSVTQRLAALSQRKSYARGTVIFREGDVHDGFYIVRSGYVVLEMGLAGRGSSRLLTIGPGELLAWSSLIGDSCMTATAIAQDDVELIALSGRDLAVACEADHELGFQLMRRVAAGLSKRLLATRLQLLDMFLADAPADRGVTA